MKKENKHPTNKPILVELFVSGQGSRKDMEAAIKGFLTHTHPAVVNQELFYLEKFEILKD